MRPFLTENLNGKYGFVVAKNEKALAFYADDKEVAEYWVNSLRSICVLTNFHEEYNGIRMIGKGGFAKVISL